MDNLIKNAISAISDGIVILDKAGEVVFSNKLGDSLKSLGIPESEDEEVIQHADEFFQFSRKNISGGQLLHWRNVTAMEKIKSIMIIDPKTGAFNAQYMKDEIERELDRVHREGQLALALIDLEMGENGPESEEIISTFRNTLRNFDRICKGDRSDYALILFAVDPDKMETIAQRILNGLKKLEIPRVSIGITLSERVASAEAMIRQAQRALYVVNARGGNDISIY